jgi:hypothetical protein
VALDYGAFETPQVNKSLSPQAVGSLETLKAGVEINSSKSRLNLSYITIMLPLKIAVLGFLPTP